jgi:tetratricopeptide (TPR) repeat protein
MNKLILKTLLLFLITGSFAFSQQSKLQMKGDQFLQKEKFDEALEYLESLSPEEQESDPLFNYYMGMVYFYSPELKKDALPFISSYIDNTDSSQIEYYGHQHFYYKKAKMLHLKYKFDEAIKAYEFFINKIFSSPSFTEDEKKQIIRQALLDLEHCKFAKIAIKNPRNVIIESLGDSINTKYPEYASVVSQDEKQLIFTSRRPDTRGGKRAKEGGGFYEDIYTAKLIKGSLFERDNHITDTTRVAYINLVTDFSYENFHRLSDEVNSVDHDGSIQLDKNDKILYFYHDANVWKTDLKSEETAVAEKLGTFVNSDNYEPSIFFSYDEEKLFIVSDRPGGYGGLDIYVSDKISATEWGPAKNLGPSVNTIGDEDAPYLDPDQKTLYFASKGHSSIGGFDIFRSKLKDTLWSKPVNLGFPINTPADDIYFTMTHRYNRGYYASADLNGLGDMDLYRITFADERDPVAELLGFVKKGDEFIPAKSKITLSTLDGNELISDKSDTITGDYFLLLGHGKNYKMIVETEGFMPYERTFEIPEQLEYFQLYQEIHHIHLFNTNGEIIGQQITVYNAFGEPDSTTTLYSEETLATIGSIRAENDIEGNIRQLKELRFYITEDSLRKMMVLDESIDYNLSDDVEVYFLRDESDDDFKLNSHELYLGDLSRKNFINKDDITLTGGVETPEGTTAAETIGGLFFTVQIGVYSKDVEHSVLFNLKPLITKKTSENQFRYSTGTFKTLSEAKVRKGKIVNMGVTDAFVTAYYKGERISIEKAKELMSSGIKVNGSWEK